MANLVKNVVVGRPLSSGGVSAGDLGAVLPSTATAALDASFTGIGYISSDGVTETLDRATDKIKAWGGDVVKIVQSEFSVSWQYSMIEALQGGVNEEVYGEANVTVTPATVSTGTLVAVEINSEQLAHRSRVFDIKDGNARVRIVAPDSQITTVGDITYADEQVIAYPVTVEGFRDASGNQAYKYMDDGVFTAGP